jgi:hypothetical protein
VGSLFRGRLGRYMVCALTVMTIVPAAASAATHPSFRPRIGRALGLIPAHGQADPTSGTPIPVVYHGGSVMHGVTIHTIFWAPRGYAFSDNPDGFSYERLQQQFLIDVAHASGQTTNNAFSSLLQYPDGNGPGTYKVFYDMKTDSIDDTTPFPPKSKQCASPSGVGTCITDLQLQHELDRVITAHDPSGRGLHDLWFVFLPPDVDECVSAGSCGTNAFAGYHSLSNLGHGPVIYSPIPDPLIEFNPPPGNDPNGNPEAESALDVVAHEAVEAITDPEGVGWMDPNGFEVADKCENGPQIGTPLGFGEAGSPYNQVINGNHYLLQGMWSNATQGCVQFSSSTKSALPLARVNLTQFSSTVTGNIATAKSGIGATVVLIRAGEIVAGGRGTTNAKGGWKVTLRSPRDGSLRAVGDDRDLILVDYSHGGPAPDEIATGAGGNPFTESGWTGFYALDSGFAVGHTTIKIGPCGQTGVLTVRVSGRPTAPAIDQCGNADDIATLQTKPLGPGTSLTMTSQDNRAVTLDNPPGAAISLGVSLGEPNALPSLQNSQLTLNNTGFPLCTADLRAQAVRCSGLVQHARYVLTRGRGHVVRKVRADGNGSARFAGFRGTPGIRGGDRFTLTNGSRRVLTRLHVAHLRVDITGNQTVIASGTCEAGNYYGAPLSDVPVSPAIGVPGSTGTGTICPLSGHAKGLSTSLISQLDDRSGGQTRTEVPRFLGTAPLENATLYGNFIALAQTGLPGPHGSTTPTHSRVALTITRPGSRRVVFRAANVGTARGARVPELPVGSYEARWVLRDANGDSRTIVTQFVEAR